LISKPVKFKDPGWAAAILHRPPISWVYWPLRQFYKKTARSFAYAKIGWDNYDFDAGYMLTLLLFKLKRLQDFLLYKGNAVQDKDTLQSLRLAIRLLKRLTNDRYSYFYDRHNAKWNPTGIKMTFKELPDSDLLEMVSYRHQLPAEEQEREGAELRQAFELDDAMRERDARWCFSILAKYYRHWWD